MNTFIEEQLERLRREQGHAPERIPLRIPAPPPPSHEESGEREREPREERGVTVIDFTL